MPKNHSPIIAGATWTEGRWKGKRALSFNGSTSYVACKDNDIISETSEYTMALWIYNKEIKEAFILGDEVLGNGGTMIQMVGSGNLATFSGDYAVSSETLTLNRWTHVVYRQNSSGIDLYVNGEFKQNLLANTQNNTSHQLFLGRLGCR